MKILHASLTALIFALAALGANAQTLNWGSGVGTPITDSDGLILDENFLFELGAFAADFEPSESNLEEWRLNWLVFDTASYNPTFGYFTSTVQVISDSNGAGAYSSNLSASQENFSDLDAYLWIRDNDEPLPGSEWLLVRSDEWIFPETGGDCCDTGVIEWSISDLDNTDTPLWGRHGNVSGPGSYTTISGGTGLQTFTFVPEPSTALLAAVAGGFAVLRRRRSAP